MIQLSLHKVSLKRMDNALIYTHMQKKKMGHCNVTVVRFFFCVRVYYTQSKVTVLRDTRNIRKKFSLVS